MQDKCGSERNVDRLGLRLRGLAVPASRSNRKVIGVGLAVLDQLVLWDNVHVPVVDNKIVAYDVQGGGMVATALVAVVRLGGRAEFWGYVGADWAGDLILRGLREENVDTRHVRRLDDRQGPVIIVSVDRVTGDRRFQFSRMFEEPDEPVGALDGLQTAGCLLVDDIRPRSAVRAATEARRLGVPVVGDIGPSGLASPALLKLLDYAIVSVQHVGRMDGWGLRRACEGILAGGPRCAIITRGRDGLAAYDGQRFLEQKAFPVNVVDTTGAGDTFHGAFCYGLVRGLDLGRNLVLASAAAAMKCRKLGGRAGIPTLAEAVQFLHEQGIDWIAEGSGHEQS